MFKNYEIKTHVGCCTQADIDGEPVHASMTHAHRGFNREEFSLEQFTQKKHWESGDPAIFSSSSE